MNSKSNTLPIVAMAVACLALVGASAWALGVGPFGSGDDDRGEVIATVGGQPIYLSEAQSRIEGLAATHGANASPLSSSDWPDTVLQSLVDDRIVRAEAERLGISVTDKDIADEVLSIQGEMFSSPAEFQSWLQSQGMALSELERRIELQMLTVRVFNGVTADVDVSAERLREYYDANAADFTAPDGSVTPFSEARDSIEQTLKSDAYSTWLDGQRRSVDVVVVDDEWWRKIDEQQI